MSVVVFDTESDGLIDSLTKFWCMGWTDDGETIHTTTSYDTMLEVLDNSEAMACHNAFTHDFPAFEKVLGYRYEGLKIDTLWLSWYLDPKRPKHGLGSYEEEFGIKKVYVDPDDWTDIDIDLALKRVTEDVKLNWLVWKKHERLLHGLYG